MTTKEAVEGMGLTVPTVHLNGTSRDALLQQYSDTASAVREAIRVLCENGPNGRDYYMHPGAFEKAVKEHTARHQKLTAVYDELFALMLAIEE